MLLNNKILNSRYFLNTKIGVDIKGYVSKPGYYELDNNLKVIDAIKLAGGLLENADTSLINLSKNVEDEMVIIIYSKEETEEMQEGSKLVKYISGECICPSLENNACIEFNYQTLAPFKGTNTKKINLNIATLNELMTLKGIGKTKAEAIIEYRNISKFKNIEELKKVKGIGNATYEKLKDQITV